MGLVCSIHGYDHSLLGNTCDPSKVNRNADKPVVTLKANKVTVDKPKPVDKAVDTDVTVDKRKAYQRAWIKAKRERTSQD